MRPATVNTIAPVAVSRASVRASSDEGAESVDAKVAVGAGASRRSRDRISRDMMRPSGSYQISASSGNWGSSKEFMDRPISGIEGMRGNEADPEADAGGVTPPSPRMSAFVFSPAKALDIMNQGLEKAGARMSGLTQKIVGSVTSTVPDPAKSAEFANEGMEEVEKTLAAAENFVSAIIRKAALSLQSQLPPVAQGVDRMNAELERAGDVLEKAESIAEDATTQAVEIIRGLVPSPAQGMSLINSQIAHAGELTAEAERIAESMASQAAAAISKHLPAPSAGLEEMNKGVEQVGQLAKLVSERMAEKVKKAVARPLTVSTDEEQHKEVGSTGRPSLSTAQMADKINKGIERVERAARSASERSAFEGTTEGGAAGEMEEKGQEEGMKVKEAADTAPSRESVSADKKVTSCVGKRSDESVRHNVQEGEIHREGWQQASNESPSPTSEPINRTSHEKPEGSVASTKESGKGAGDASVHKDRHTGPHNTRPSGLLGTMGEALEHMHQEFERGLRMDGYGRGKAGTVSAGDDILPAGAQCVVRQEMIVETEGKAGEVEETTLSGEALL